MKIATWNVNSLRMRLPHLLRWLREVGPDLLALQETKLSDDQFPAAEFAALGYRPIISGQKGYNGVALLSRLPVEGEVLRELPGFPDSDRRVVGVAVGPLWLLNLYAPNGQVVGSERYAYKLAWFDRLTRYLEEPLQRFAYVAVVGDLNIAPDERDVYDPRLWSRQILFSEGEREALRRLMGVGLVDLVRRHHGDEKIYSWWDYRFFAFKNNRGLRIDHILANDALAQRCVRADVDPLPRGWEKPSDHAPVIAEFTDLR